MHTVSSRPSARTILAGRGSQIDPGTENTPDCFVQSDQTARKSAVAVLCRTAAHCPFCAFNDWS